MDVRQKAKDLMALALDTKGSDNERLNAAFAALKLINENGLLESPLAAIDNELVQELVDGSKLAADLFRRGKKVAERMQRGRKR